MAGELADEVRVFDLLVEVIDEGAAGHMGVGDVADGVLQMITSFEDRMNKELRNPEMLHYVHDRIKVFEHF